MSNRLELEKSFVIEKNLEKLLKKIEKEGFSLTSTDTEEDTYFTDKQLEFIQDRVCLRTRKTNEKFLELTYKPKSDSNTERYGKREVNIRINPEDYEDIKYVIDRLGYLEYVSFKKHRSTYSKVIDGYVHNIMIDNIEGVGDFAEFEILSEDEENKELLAKKLDMFITLFECNKYKEKTKPYRDIVKEYMEKKD